MEYTQLFLSALIIMGNGMICRALNEIVKMLNKLWGLAPLVQMALPLLAGLNQMAKLGMRRPRIFRCSNTKGIDDGKYFFDW